MKVYINREYVSGPWGGGNKTVKLLKDKCIENNFSVVHTLKDEDIDVIFCIDPRPNNKGEWYQDIINYKNKKPDTKIIQRVGDVGTHSKPELTQLVKQSTNYSDFIIFPSDWARKYIQYDKKNYIIINNQPKSLFYKNRQKENVLGEKIKIVTHHWSKNPKKGFDVYEALGKYIKEQNANIELTYIGRYSESNGSDGINLIEPQDDNSLASLLPQHDIYLTASIEEAGANHVLEALAAGLPIIYRTGGGSINEYCRNYGLEYDNDMSSLISSINSIILNYPFFKKNVISYKGVLNESIEKYIDIIKGYE